MAISQIYDMSARQVWVGRYDEHGSREVAWDVSPWTSKLGSDGVFALLVTRPRDTDSPYNAQVSFDASTNLVTWAVTDVDTALKGWGRAELHYYVDGALVKSQTFVTIIEKAMFAGSTAPSAAESWVERMEQAALDAQAAAETAEDAETTATSAATTATSAAATAITAANSASSSASSARADATTATNAATAAALSESAASTSATNAAASAEAASTSALTASTAASTATTKASQASASASTAATAATTATNKASEATTAAQTATTKAGEASTSASTATSAKDTAVSASQTATTKATEATTAAATATSAATTATTAKDDAVSAKTAAQTAQTGAETAAASVQSSAAQIATNAADISQLKSDLTLETADFTLLKTGVADGVYEAVQFTENAGYLIIGSGVATAYANNNYCVSNLIAVEAGETYYITASANYANLMYAWYKSDETFISGRATGGSGATVIGITNEKIVVPANAAYIRIAYIKPKQGTVNTLVGYKNNLDTRVEALEDSVFDSNVTTVTLEKNSTSLKIVDDKTGRYIEAVTNGSNNKAFNFRGYYNSNNTGIKAANDDICPMFYDGSYRCGNHGNLVVIAVTAQNHGLTASDIGKVVKTQTNTPFVIVTIPNENTVWLINDSSSQSFITSIPQSPLIGDGVTIAFTAGELKQLSPGINNIYQKIYVDNTEITTDGSYTGKKITILDGYYSIDTLAMLDYLKTNVGNNTNDTFYSDTLDADLLYETTYTITCGLGMYISSTILILRDGLSLSSWCVTQSQSLRSANGSDFYYYISDTNDDGITEQTADINTYTEVWKNSDFPPYKFFQFTDLYGFAIVYDISVGDCAPNIRKNLQNVYNCSISTKKMYPFVKNGSETFSKGDVIKGAAYRLPVSKTTPLAIMYSVNKRKVLEIDTFSDALNFVTIPNYNGYEIEVIHVSDGVQVIDNVVVGDQLRIYGKGSVSVVLK